MVLIAVSTLAAAAPAFPSIAPGDSVIKVWVELKDKGPELKLDSSVPSRPGQPAFTLRTMENAPVYPKYAEALSQAGLAISVRLKWQNKISGYIAPSGVKKLRALPFVASVREFPRRVSAPKDPPRIPIFRPWTLFKSAVDTLNYGASRAMMDGMHINRVHNWLASQGQKPGQGIRIAVIDADFHLASLAFDKMLTEHRLKDQWDFVDNRAAPVDRDTTSSHGAETLSLIAGEMPGVLMGVAPEAEFLLYRSEEDARERYIEEDWVAAAVERAVDSGAQVISISLGYRNEYTDGSPDLPFSALDGRTRPSSLAVLGAARRNVVVSVAIGNLDGSLPVGHSLTVPADADSILSVGIADARHRRCDYSCTGPTADHRIKPEVVGLGLVGSCAVEFAPNSRTPGLTTAGAGTSFATPVIAGVAALLRQANPQASAEDIRQALIHTADKFTEPDSEVGYGVADAWAALNRLRGVTQAKPNSDGTLRLFHSGGRTPLFLAWDFKSPRAVELLDASGRRVEASMELADGILSLHPKRDLQSGVYMVRVRKALGDTLGF